MLQPMGLQRVGHDIATEPQQQHILYSLFKSLEGKRSRSKLLVDLYGTGKVKD